MQPEWVPQNLELRRSRNYHLGNSQFHLGGSHPSVAQQSSFQFDHPLKELRAVKRCNGIICRDLLLATKAAGKIYFLAVRSGEGRRDAVQPAYHEPVRIK